MVSLVTRTSSTLTVTWDVPATPNGLVTRYSVLFNPVLTTGLANPAGGPVTVPLDMEEPAMVLLGVATGLRPATTYAVTLTAFTSAGSSSGADVQLDTEEAGTCAYLTMPNSYLHGQSSHNMETAWSRSK